MEEIKITTRGMKERDKNGERRRVWNADDHEKDEEGLVGRRISERSWRSFGVQREKS